MSAIVKGLKAALELIETNGWWDGTQRTTKGSGDARLQTMCVVTATYWTEVADGEGIRRDSELDLQWSLWNALPDGCRTGLGRTKDLVDFNDAHTEDDVKALFARAITAEESKSCTT